MRNFIAVVLLAGMAAISPATGQTIYKCKSATGSNIYSQEPCGKHGDKVTLAPVRKLSPMQQSRVDAQNTKYAEQDKAQQLNRRQEQCVRNMTSGQLSGSDERIYRYRKQIRGLQATVRRASNNLAGATWESGLREQISGLNQSISSEQATQAHALSNARSVCNTQRAAWEADLDRKSQTP